MPNCDVDGLRFEFPEGWNVSKYDDWPFYKNQFQKIKAIEGDGVKAIDIVAVSPDRSLWLIEVKDFRLHPRIKPLEISQEIALKAFDTLAALLPARLNSNTEEELKISTLALKATRLRVVFYLAQPLKHSRLFPRAIDPATVKMKLRQRVRSIDPHPVVAEHGIAQNLPWTVN